MFCRIEKDRITDKLEPYILHENEKYYYLPRLIKRHVKNDNIQLFRDPSFSIATIDPWKFTSELRDGQKEIMAEIIGMYETDGIINGIVHARPGFGKTVSSIYIATYLCVKTLIIIDTEKIMEQWKAEILAHTDLTEDDIGIIKGNKFDVENKKFIISTPQTLASKVKRNVKDNYTAMKELGIGLVVWDEVHKMGNKYASASLLFNTLNLLGLSATPYNPLERDTLIKSMFNEVIVRYGEYDFQPVIKFIKYNSELGPTYGKRVYYMWSKDFIQGRSIYNSKLHESSNWINVIHKIVQDEVIAGNKIIIMCMTKLQLEFICNFLESRDITTTKLFSEKHDIDKTKDNVIVATYKYASHAFDYAELSRLILAVPLSGKKSLIQTIGRVVRSFPGKTDAIVYDLIDVDSEFRGLFTSSIEQKKSILVNEFDNCTFEVGEVILN
jgi:superfamily II DNA or RNA helicase